MKTVVDNINVDMNNKAEDGESEVKTENVEETLEDVVNVLVIKTMDVEKSSEPIEVDKVKKVRDFFLFFCGVK